MKRYTFDKDKFYELYDSLYKVNPGLYSELVIDCFTKENFIKVINGLQEILDNPKVTDVELPPVPREEITCFNEETNKKLNEIFSNKDLVFFGHGGAADKIIETEFRCKYPNLPSHFVQLNQTNESLSKLDKWPHKECSKVAIMALNIHEFNPIYKENNAESIYDETMYSIPNEYFVGYYDKEKSEFIMNPNFKERHELDNERTIYQTPFSAFQVDGPDEAKEFYGLIRNISNILYFSSNNSYLDERGYKQVKEQVLHKIKELKKLQDIMTPEYIEKNKKSETYVESTPEEFDWSGFDSIFPPMDSSRLKTK